MKFENVSRLLADLGTELKDFGYALCDAAGKLVMEQKGLPSPQSKGVVRTNCVDCLDRTNVVQVMDPLTE